ncbi:hypothetical protein P8605_07325, partial [Streptomyces sp. T-3]|nr:hypothetical protein [Streptomyces sp. T-3]
VHARDFFDDLVGERPGDADTQTQHGDKPEPHHGDKPEPHHADKPERRSWGTLRRRDTSRGSTP